MQIALNWPQSPRPRPPVAAPDGVVYKSPGLELLSDRLESLAHATILDLAAPSGANVEHLSAYPCSVHIEDLYRTLAGDPRCTAEPEERDACAIAEDCFVFPADVRFDVVFGWDLFDHLTEDVIEMAMRRVTRQCRTGTLLYLLAATAEEIPSRPGDFIIVDRNHIRHRPAATAERPNPRLSPRRLERLLPGFRLQHSFLLGDGMQDYLFVHE